MLDGDASETFGFQRTMVDPGIVSVIHRGTQVGWLRARPWTGGAECFVVVQWIACGGRGGRPDGGQAGEPKR